MTANETTKNRYEPGMEIVTEPTTATIKLRIENRYEDGFEVVTEPTVTVPLPIPPADSEARDEWDYDHIFPHTGTGWTKGDSWYDVEIVESTAPELVGLTFEFGY